MLLNSPTQKLHMRLLTHAFYLNYMNIFPVYDFKEKRFTFHETKNISLASDET